MSRKTLLIHTMWESSSLPQGLEILRPGDEVGVLVEFSRGGSGAAVDRVHLVSWPPAPGQTCPLQEG